MFLKMEKYVSYLLSDDHSDATDDDRDLENALDFEPTDIDYGSDEDGTVSRNPQSNEVQNNEMQTNEITYGADLSLAPILKTKANSDIELWKMFGILMKNNKIVQKVSDRIFCALCLDKKTLKRQVFIFHFHFLSLCAIFIYFWKKVILHPPERLI